jgi:hypothetical protein
MSYLVVNSIQSCIKDWEFDMSTLDINPWNSAVAELNMSNLSCGHLLVVWCWPSHHIIIIVLTQSGLSGPSLPKPKVFSYCLMMLHHVPTCCCSYEMGACCFFSHCDEHSHSPRFVNLIAPWKDLFETFDVKVPFGRHKPFNIELFVGTVSMHSLSAPVTIMGSLENRQTFQFIWMCIISDQIKQM